MEIEQKRGGVTELSKDLNIITAEINAYQRIAGEAVFEIGRRLKYVREMKLAEQRGGWNAWCENDLGISRRYANMFIKVADELPESGKMYSHLGINVLYEIATLTEPERNQPHTIPSTGETKTVDEMTVRELREVKKALREAEEGRKRAERDAQTLRDTIESTEEKPLEIEYIEVKDVNAERELAQYKKLFGDISIYEGKATRVTNGDAITYTVYEFSEDVRKFLEKYSHLTYFTREFNEMIDEGKNEYRKSIDAMMKFLMSIERNLNENEAIIIEG